MNEYKLGIMHHAKTIVNKDVTLGFRRIQL